MKLRPISTKSDHSLRALDAGLGIAVTLLMAVVLPSPIVHSLLGLDYRLVFLSTMPLMFFTLMLRSGAALPSEYLTASFLVLLIGVLASLVSGADSQWLMAGTFVVASGVAVISVRHLRQEPIITTLNLFAWVYAVSSIVALAYALGGGGAIRMVDIGRPSYLYLTAFTPTVRGAFIRPAAIFDEPGALGFYLTIVAAVNTLYGVHRATTPWLLLLGLVTGSLALLFVFVAYVVFELRLRIIHLATVVTVAVVVVSIPATTQLYEFAEQAFVDRLSSPNYVRANNRTRQVITFFELIDEDILLRGRETDSFVGDVDQSSNPFSIVYNYGLIIAVPYYVMLVFAVWVVVRGNRSVRFAAVAVVLLLLHRPYVYHLWWNLSLSYVVYVLYRKQRGRQPSGIAGTKRVGVTRLKLESLPRW